MAITLSGTIAMPNCYAKVVKPDGVTVIIPEGQANIQPADSAEVSSLFPGFDNDQLPRYVIRTKKTLATSPDTLTVPTDKDIVIVTQSSENPELIGSWQAIRVIDYTGPLKSYRFYVLPAFASNY